MGTYLSTPVLDKHKETGTALRDPCYKENNKDVDGNEQEDEGVFDMLWAAVDMQGWRKTMEDAFIAEANVSIGEKRAQVFGVFDGHGGSEVALFCKKYFVSKLVGTDGWKAGEVGQSLVQAFHGMDDLIDDENNRNELEMLRIEGNKRAKDPSSDNDCYGDVSHEDDGESGEENSDVVSSENRGVKTISASDAIELFQKLLYMGGTRNTGESIASKNTPIDSETQADLLSDDVNITSEYVKSSSTESIQSDQTDSKSLLNETTEKKSSGDSIDGLDLTSNGLPRKQICTLDDHPIRAGCTAVVGVLVGNELIVANAGDSRAVICRAGGGAEALSFDHKPSHEIEKNRVLAAGGFVNSFGRINGNLNLSRSIGDLKYKQNKSISPKEQMITAEPDIVSVLVKDNDEFLIIGCDGIWDCLSNQEAVDFVLQRIDTTHPTEILEEMLNTIVAEDPKATQGIGGDNMTALIVDFQVGKRAYSIEIPKT